MEQRILDSTIKSIECQLEKWGYFVTISKLQIIIIDKQLRACHSEKEIFEEGYIVKFHFEISKKSLLHSSQYMVFLNLLEKKYNPSIETSRKIPH